MTLYLHHDDTPTASMTLSNAPADRAALADAPTAAARMSSGEPKATR